MRQSVYSRAMLSEVLSELGYHKEGGPVNSRAFHSGQVRRFRHEEKSKRAAAARKMAAGKRLFARLFKQAVPAYRIVSLMILYFMPSVSEIISLMRRNPKGVRHADLCRVCDYCYGEARQSGSSDRVYITPWAGDPRVNIQNAHGKVKAYQVRQVIRAIDLLEESHGRDKK